MRLVFDDAGNRGRGRAVSNMSQDCLTDSLDEIHNEPERHADSGDRFRPLVAQDASDEKM